MTARNRPGIGPYSTGRYYRQDARRYTINEPIPEVHLDNPSQYLGRRNRPGVGPYSFGRYYRERSRKWVHNRWLGTEEGGGESQIDQLLGIGVGAAFTVVTCEGTSSLAAIEGTGDVTIAELSSGATDTPAITATGIGFTVTPSEWTSLFHRLR